MNEIFLIFNLLYLLFLHFIADFICQTNWQAQNKSKNNWALLSHVSTYSIVFYLGLLPFGFFGLTRSFNDIYFFVLINGFLHFLTDYITSRINSYYWGKGDRKTFFVGIGADQFTHTATLFLTYYFIFLN